MNDSLLFLSNFIKYPKEVGSIVPSSKSLTKEVIKGIDFKKSDFIVELGPGSGTFTKAILKRARPDSRVICFEVNKKFCNYLNEKIIDKRLTIINSGAEKINRNFGIKQSKADYVVSGLPFRNFSAGKKKKIIGEVRNCMKDDGKFILFQYTNDLKKLLESYFPKVERKFVPANIPPAFVYVCEKQ